MNNRLSFENVFQQNRKRFHYHLHHLQMQEPLGQGFPIRPIPIWQQHPDVRLDNGTLATYFHVMIRARYIQHAERAGARHPNNSEKEQAFLQHSSCPCPALSVS